MQVKPRSKSIDKKNVSLYYRNSDIHRFSQLKLLQTENYSIILQDSFTIFSNRVGNS